MFATLGQLPEGEGWAWEMKWDGQRAIAQVNSGSSRLFSRNGNDITAAFPELAGPLADVLDGRDANLDGEIVALDAKGRPSFGRLQRRMHVLRPTTTLRADVPVVLYLFDVLSLDGHSTTSLPYAERRADLDALGFSGPRVQVPPYWTDVGGDRMLDLAREHHLEGVVAKRLDSTYRPGRRSPAWIKHPLRARTPRPSSSAGSTGPAAPAAASDRCCSARTTTMASSPTSGTSAPASQVPADGPCGASSHSWSDRRAPSPHRRPPGTPKEPTGSSPNWWAMSSSASTPAEVCGTPRGRACATTSRRAMSISPDDTRELARPGPFEHADAPGGVCRPGASCGIDYRVVTPPGVMGRTYFAPGRPLAVVHRICPG